jgi:PAS domain S-box-containing protein
MPIERASSGIEAGAELRERLASLLTLSLEPMLVWRLDGPIEFWNTGAERLYGFVSDEAVGRSSHDLLQTKFPVKIPKCIHNFRMSITGRVSFVTSVREAEKSS